MIKSLDRMNIPPLDQIIVADVDELYTYGHSTIGLVLAEMEREGATFALAEALDYVASTGNLIVLAVGSMQHLIFMSFPSSTTGNVLESESVFYANDNKGLHI